MVGVQGWGKQRPNHFSLEKPITQTAPNSKLVFDPFWIAGLRISYLVVHNGSLLSSDFLGDHLGISLVAYSLLILKSEETFSSVQLKFSSTMVPLFWASYCTKHWHHPDE